MKRNVLCFLSCLILLSCIQEIPNTQNSSIQDKPLLTKSHDIGMAYYYSATGKREYLIESTEHLFVVFDSSLLTELASISSTSVSNILNTDIEPYTFVVDSYLTNECFCAKITREVAALYNDHILYSAPYYITPEGDEIGLTNIFRIQLYDSEDISKLEDFAQSNNVKIIRNNTIPLWYTLSCTTSSSQNALELANQAHESGLFAACDIEFRDAISIEINLYSYSDPLYANQWNLHSSLGFDLGIDNVHFITRGNGVSIAVVDNGIDISHPDLEITTSWDATHEEVPAKNYSYSTSEVNFHGTATTGLIGAQINDIGIVGIAPSSTLIPISVQFNSVGGYSKSTSEALADAIYYAAYNGADVISNSWSSASDNNYINSAIAYALSSGRNDKGSVVVFASGNQSQSFSRFPHASNANIISVGNTDSLGIRHPSSNYGPDLDVVAPGTNIELLGGNKDYKKASGTSLSCPQVAAVASLMLSVNPNLTNLQVSEIIDKTAGKLPSYAFSTTSGRSNGTWNEEVGYGLVNAMDAVSLAKGYYNLISFDYTGHTVEFSLTANKDIAIIWDWETSDITEVALSSSTKRNFTHTYSTNKKRRIYIAEKIDFETDSIPTHSTALTEFDLSTGEHASDIDIKSLNSSLEYIRIIGGESIASQTISIKDLPSLKDLYLVRMPDVAVEINNCPSLLRFGSSRYIWGAPPDFTINPDLPTFPVEGEIIGINGTNDGSNDPVWPDIPEPVKSFSSLSISNCTSLTDISLENVDITQFDCRDFPNLRYLYISSQDDRIVGVTDDQYPALSKGKYLVYTITSLPSRTDKTFNGRVRIRGINPESTAFVNAIIGSHSRSTIYRICEDKDWDIIWDPGVSEPTL